jgi:hypothetical protein
VQPRYRPINSNPALARDQEFLRLYYKSVRHGWNLEEIASRDFAFDFTLPFMPDPVTSAEARQKIDPFVQLRLSQIRGNEYLSIIIFIEDVIVDFLWNYVGRNRYVAPHETQQALTNFICEEMKHTLLFQSFRQKFERDVGVSCRTIERTPAFSRFVLKFDPLGVLLFILHGEVMTYINYLSSVKNCPQRLDPFFSMLLKYHWIEEAGHVTLDELLLDDLLRPYDEKRIVKAIRDYFTLIDFLYGALRQVSHFDIHNLCAIGAAHDPVMDTRRELLDQQRRFYVQSYLLDVMESPRFRKSFVGLTDRAIPLLDEKIEFLKNVIS